MDVSVIKVCYKCRNNRSDQGTGKECTFIQPVTKSYSYVWVCLPCIAKIGPFIDATITPIDVNTGTQYKYVPIDQSPPSPMYKGRSLDDYTIKELHVIIEKLSKKKITMV